MNASTVPLFLNGGLTGLGNQGEDRQLNAIRDRRQLWVSIFVCSELVNFILERWTYPLVSFFKDKVLISII